MQQEMGKAINTRSTQHSTGWAAVMPVQSSTVEEAQQR